MLINQKTDSSQAVVNQRVDSHHAAVHALTLLRLQTQAQLKQFTMTEKLVNSMLRLNQVKLVEKQGTTPTPMFHLITLTTK